MYKYTLTIGTIPGRDLELGFETTLDLAEAYAVLTTNGLRSDVISCKQDGEPFDLRGFLDGMNRMLAVVPEGKGWWND